MAIGVDTISSIQEIFEAQAAQSPNTKALVFSEQSLSYQALNSRSNQLANYLRGRGVSPGTLVGLSVSPSLEIVVAIWGIIKAGGAYVPLDPSYPSERLRYMVADAGVQLILTQSQWRGSLEELRIPLIDLDTDWSLITQEEDHNLEIVNDHRDLAYVIYTSGSTGQPKGVMITHGNLISFVDTVKQSLGVNSQGIYLLSASVNYALAVRQIFVPLCSGARLVVANEEQRVNPLAQLELIQQSGVTAVDYVPTFWRTCNQLLTSQPVDVRHRLLDNQLQQIVSVGEPLHAEIPRTWREKFKHKARIVNIFGQTETTGIVAMNPIQNGTLEDSEVVPIGQAVPKVKLFIMDSDIKPVPQGEVGELCVSTPCLGQGYINNPELTADKYVENQMQPGERLYRTGDLARCLSNGDIQHLGRIDQQVKIRGIRIELAEIEAVLRQYEGVQDVIVNSIERSSGGNQLVAYLILVKDHQVSREELHKNLMDKLPDHMVPTIYMTLEQFPLTPNGKVDRCALPVPEQNFQLEDNYIPPRDDLERSLVELWEEILGVRPIGIRDGFQSLGGDSLLAARVIARVEEKVGKRLPISYFTNVHTVEDLAATFHKEGWQQNQSTLVALQPYGPKSKFFIVHGVGGHLLRFTRMAQHFAPDYPLFGLQSRGLNGNREPFQSIEAMAAHYIKEIITWQPEGPYHLGGFSYGGFIAYEMAQQLHSQGQSVALLALLDTQAMLAPQYLSSLTGSRYIRFRIRSMSHKTNYIMNQISMLRPVHMIKYAITGLNGGEKMAIDFGDARKDETVPKYFKLVMDKNFSALEGYRLKPYNGKVTMIKSIKHGRGTYYGWNELAMGGVETHFVSGTHTDILQEPNVGALVEQLKACIDRTTIATLTD